MKSSFASPVRRVARWLPSAGRLLLGLIFFVFGLNGFLNFIPPPAEPPPPGALAFGQALFASGYLFQLIKGTEVITGALLLANFLVPFALVLLAPVIVNIFLFHVVLAPSGWLLATTLVVIEALLAYHYRSAYAPLFRRPDTAVKKTAEGIS